MRTIPAPELALWLGQGARRYRARVRRPGEVVWTDLSAVMGGDWLIGVRSEGESPDQPAGRFVFDFLKHETAASLSPGISASPLNVDAALAFRPLLHPGRSIEVDVRVGAEPWRLWFAGDIEDAEWPGDAVTVTCLTLDGRILAAQIEEEEERGVDDPGTPIAEEIQSILERWMGAAAPTLRVLGAPGWNVGRSKPAIGSLGEHLRTLAQANGWDLRYLWSEADSGFRYTLYLPPRDKTSVDLAIPAADTFAVGGLRQSRQWVRNAFPIRFYDSANTLQSVTVEDAGSIAEYGRLAMPITEGEGSAVRSAAAATALGEYARSDLARPLVDGRFTIPFLPWLELHDVVVFQEDGDHFDYDTQFAIVGLSHRVEAEGGAWTEVEVRGGTPVGAYYSWHKRAADGARAAEPALVMIRDWKPGPETETHKSWVGLPTDAVEMITIHDILVARPYVEAEVLPGPASGRRPDRAVLRPGPGAWAFSYLAEKPPEGYDRLIQVEPRDKNGDAGKVERAKIEGHQAAIQLPTIEWVEQVETDTPSATGLHARVSDPAGRAGVLFVWLNPDSFDNPNPNGPPDGSITIGVTPHTVLEDDVFILTAGGNRALFQGVKVHAGRGKRIYLEFVTEDGVSTGKVDKALQSWLQLIDPSGTGFLAESVTEAALALRSVGTFQLKLAGVERENIIQKAVNAALLDDNILDLTQFNRVVLDNAIVAGKLAVNQLSEIAPDVGIIVSGELRNAAGTRYIDLDATGSQPFIASEKLSVFANGNADFGGRLTATTVFAARIVVSGAMADGSIDLPGLFVDGVVRAAAMQLSTLSEIKKSDGTPVGMGIIVEGILRNPANTAGIRLAAADGAIPASWTAGLDLAAGAADRFLWHPALALNGDGSAWFEGEVRIGAGKGIFFGSASSSYGWGAMKPWENPSNPNQQGLEVEVKGVDALKLYRHLNISVGIDQLGFLFAGQQVVTVYVGATRPSNPVEGTLRVE